MANSYEKMSSDNAPIIDAYAKMQERLKEEKASAAALQRELDNKILSEEIPPEETISEGKTKKEKQAEKDLEKIADELEESKKDIKKIEKEIEDELDELDEDRESEYDANNNLSRSVKPGFYIKKNGRRVSGRHETINHAMKTFKDLGEVDRKDCKIVNESMEDMLLSEGIMNPEHDEKDQVMLKKLHKILPELGLKKAIHTASFKSRRNGNESYNTYSAEQPVPEHMKHLFKTLHVDVETNHKADDGDHSARVSYKYTHPEGGSNGLTIGDMVFDKIAGKHHYIPRDSSKERSVA